MTQSYKFKFKSHKTHKPFYKKTSRKISIPFRQKTADINTELT